MLPANINRKQTEPHKSCGSFFVPCACVAQSKIRRFYNDAEDIRTAVDTLPPLLVAQFFWQNYPSGRANTPDLRAIQSPINSNSNKTYLKTKQKAQGLTALSFFCI